MAEKPTSTLTHLVSAHLHSDYLALLQSWSSERALEEIRRVGDDRKVSYYYTVDERQKLVGVIPARSLLHAAPSKLLADLAIRNLVTVSAEATMEQAARAFTNHKFLAIPALRSDGTIAGVLDLQAFAGENIDHGDKALVEEMFQTIGVRLEETEDRFTVVQHQVRTLEIAEHTLTATMATADPVRMFQLAAVAQSYYTEVENFQPEEPQPAIYAAKMMCDAWRATAVERIDELRALSFAMAGHKRLGAGSILSRFPSELFQYLCRVAAQEYVHIA
jgi:CBS domain-containing protein